MSSQQTHSATNAASVSTPLIPRAPPPRSSDPSIEGGAVTVVPQSSGGVDNATTAMTIAKTQNRSMVSARTAPSNGNMFTRFMKTSTGADVAPPLPRSEAQQLHLIPNTQSCLKSSSARLPERHHTFHGGNIFSGTATSNASTTAGGFLATGGTFALAGPTATGVELNPLHRPKADPRRQIGILCNNMTTLDMVELAHKIVPAVSLGSPRFETQAPPKLGEERYDYGKHQRASTKVVERADAALGQRSSINVVFYNTNPGALTSRRDFKLITVPNHRDIQDSLEQQQLAKLATRCAHHVTAGFDPSSSSEDDETKKRRHAAKKLRRGLGNAGGAAGAASGALATTTAVASADSGEANNKTVTKGSGAAALSSKTSDTSGMSPGGSNKLPQQQQQQQQDTTGRHHGQHLPSCSCVHCVYVRDELDAFDRARNPATAKPGTSEGRNTTARKQTMNKKSTMPRSKQTQQSAENGQSLQRNEQHRRFLGGAAFSGTATGGASAATGTTAAVLAAGGGAGNSNAPPLLQRLLTFQAALKWIRGLDKAVHAAMRCNLVLRYPNLRNDFDTSVSARLRRMTVSELLLIVATTVLPQGVPIPPRRRGVEVELDSTSGRVLQTPVAERYSLPARPVYGVNHYQQNKSSAPAPPVVPQSVSGRTSVDTAAITTSATLNASAVVAQPVTPPLSHAEMLAIQRPWEALFTFFDTNLAGTCDRFHLLLSLLAATSHHVILEPEGLKLDCRPYSHMTCIVLLISGVLLHERRPADGPVRLGEIFAIRDFLKTEILAAKALASIDVEGWIYDPHTGELRPQGSLSGLTHDDLVDHPKLTHKKAQEMLKGFDAALSRVDEFASVGISMIHREDLLDAAQVASMLQECLLL